MRRKLLTRGASARRIIDCFFLMGPKVLFQVGCVLLYVLSWPRCCADSSRTRSLAILKLNSPELLETTDDGAFIKCVCLSLSALTVLAPAHVRRARARSVLKAYFATLGDSAHPNAHDPKTRQITKFQELCAFLVLPLVPLRPRGVSR